MELPSPHHHHSTCHHSPFPPPQYNRKQVLNRFIKSGKISRQSTCRSFWPRPNWTRDFLVLLCVEAPPTSIKGRIWTQLAHRTDFAEVLTREKRTHGSIAELVCGWPSSRRKCWVLLCCWRRRVCDRKAWVFLEVARSIALWSNPCLNGSQNECA